MAEADYSEVKSPHRYWGIYCPQHNVWLTWPEGREGRELVFYPSPAIAHAALWQLSWGDNHLWEVTEYGEQKPVNVQLLGRGSQLCSVRL